MNIKPIKNEKDYDMALARIDGLWESKPGTAASDELDILITLIEKYEADNYEILPPDPIEAIKFRMEQMGLEQKDIAKIIGANRISEILSKKRKLSLNMIRNLHTNLNIPTESLIN